MKQTKLFINSKVVTLASLVALMVATFAPFMVPTTQAAAGTLNRTFVRIDRHKNSTATTGTVCVQPFASSVVVRKVDITFPTNFVTSNANFVNTNINTTNLAWPASASAFPGITTEVASGTTPNLILTMTADQSVTAATTYCFNWTVAAALTTPASAGNDLTGSIVLRDNSNVAIETGFFGTSVVSATNDQYTVGATVPQLFTFVGPASATDNFTANLSKSALQSTTGATATISTNAANGYMVWAKSGNATAGIKSVLANKTITATTPGTNVVSSVGSEQYAYLVTGSQNTGGGSAGTFTPTVAYNSNMGSGLANSLTTILTSTGVANADTVTLVGKANISAVTPSANDYTDTITVVAAGLF